MSKKIYKKKSDAKAARKSGQYLYKVKGGYRIGTRAKKIKTTKKKPKAKTAGLRRTTNGYSSSIADSISNGLKRQGHKTEVRKYKGEHAVWSDRHKRPLMKTLYHGTSLEYVRNMKKTGRMTGYWTVSKPYASRYAARIKNAVPAIIEIRVNVMNQSGFWWTGSEGVLEPFPLYNPPISTRKIIKVHILKDGKWTVMK